MMNNTTVKQILNTLLLVIAAFIWGSAFVAQSVGAEYVGPFTFLAARSWVGGIFLIPVILVCDRLSKKRIGITAALKTGYERNNLVIGGLCCGLILFIASYVQQAGMAYTTTQL